MIDIKTLISIATGKVQHNYRSGLCPDEIQPDSRDPDCPACKILIEAATEHDAMGRRLREAEGHVTELESELRDDHWPHGATVKLRWAGSGYCEKYGWAKRGAEGQLITVCSGVRLDESKWEVVQERKVQPARGEG